jgi:subtilase family serine protease
VAGGPAQFRIVVRNGGDAPSGSFGLTVRWPQDQVLLQCLSLAPGEEETFTAPINYSEAGQITTVVGIGVMEDSNEENNSVELVVNVQPAVELPLPDLYVSRVSLDPVSPRVGEEVQVEVEITNGGPGDAGPHTAEWKSDPDTVACTWSVDGVPAGTDIIKSCAYTYTYPHSGQSTYAKADVANDVDEEDEDNNVRYLRVNVRPD